MLMLRCRSSESSFAIAQLVRRDQPDPSVTAVTHPLSSELPVVTATATADGIVASLTSSSDILAVAAGALASALIPVVGVALTGALATATAEGVTVVLGVDLSASTAGASAEAPVPTVAELETFVCRRPEPAGLGYRGTRPSSRVGGDTCAERAQAGNV